MQSFARFLSILAAITPLLAQTPSASVVGRVTDASGAVVPAVTIKVLNVDTRVSRQSASNDVGDFTVPYLNPGRYELEASRTGFRSYRHSQFVLEVGQTLRLDLRLEV